MLAGNAAGLILLISSGLSGFGFHSNDSTAFRFRDAGRSKRLSRYSPQNLVRLLASPTQVYEYINSKIRSSYEKCIFEKFS
jgi:hypothetical protein